MGGAPGAEPSARAGLWKQGGNLRGADDQPRFTGSSARLISLICQRTRASGRLGRGCPAGRAGGVKRLTASSPTSHPPHPTSRGSRASSGLIGGKAARRRRQCAVGEVRPAPEESRSAREKRKKCSALELPAWLAENPATGGAVFSRRTAGNDAYPPPADPPRQALTSCPARGSVFFFHPGSPAASVWISESAERHNGALELTAQH